MGKTLFHSTIEEKKQMLERLKNAPKHDDVDVAIRVIEDSLVLHDMHKLVSDIQYTFQSMFGTNDVKTLTSYNRICSGKIDEFYKRIDKRKHKRR